MPRAETFEVTERKATLFFARDVVQYVHCPPEPAYLAPGLKLHPSPKPDELVQVNLSRAFDGRSEVQLWHPKYPWPVYVEAGSTRAWLVKVASRRGSGD